MPAVGLGRIKPLCNVHAAPRGRCRLRRRVPTTPTIPTSASDDKYNDDETATHRPCSRSLAQGPRPSREGGARCRGSAIKDFICRRFPGDSERMASGSMAIVVGARPARWSSPRRSSLMMRRCRHRVPAECSWPARCHRRRWRRSPRGCPFRRQAGGSPRREAGRIAISPMGCQRPGLLSGHGFLSYL